MATPKKGSLFESTEPETETQTQSGDALVNQNTGAAPNDDDIPFGQGGDAGAGAPVSETPAGMGPDTERRQADAVDAAIEGRSVERIAYLERQLSEVIEEKNDLKTLLETANRTNKELLSRASGTQTPLNEIGGFRRQCFYAILQGMAAHGDLSIGKLTSDADTQKVVRHAAGVAAYASSAAKEAKLI